MCPYINAGGYCVLIGGFPTASDCYFCYKNKKER